jgi:TolB protein
MTLADDDRSDMEARELRPGQRSCVWTFSVDTGEHRLVYESTDVLLEAPNWLADGRLLLNGGGTLWTLTGEGDLAQVSLPGLPVLNNDHVPAPDGVSVYVSANDWHIYRAPLAGGDAVKVTGSPDHPNLMHFLHGVSPDGSRLAFVGLEPEGENWWANTSIFTISSEGGDYRRITQGSVIDGSEYSPDGEWIYFNSEGFDGHAQIGRMRPDGSQQQQLTFDTFVNWFPHISPDGNRAAYLSFPAGVEGHPADLWVEIRVVELPAWDKPRTAVRLFGGQGTLNVNSWSPDSRAFAYVSYPIGDV